MVILKKIGGDKMKIPTIHQQMFGDINKKLNSVRAQMNADIRKKCFEILEKKRQGGANGS